MSQWGNRISNLIMFRFWLMYFAHEINVHGLGCLFGLNVLHEGKIWSYVSWPHNMCSGVRCVCWARTTSTGRSNIKQNIGCFAFTVRRMCLVESQIESASSLVIGDVMCSYSSTACTLNHVFILLIQAAISSVSYFPLDRLTPK